MGRNAEGRLGVPASCVAEVLRGAHRVGGPELRRAVALLRQHDVMPIDREVAQLAGELSAECDRRGRPVGMMDCLVAAPAKSFGAVLITGDADLARIPGLSVETY
ncbi:MAG TPA: type II toxin-antitoxin system VapC family toxin [Thermoplasmata archaeon]